jgi:hypothetical protein
VRTEVEKLFLEWTSIPGIARSKSTVGKIAKPVVPATLPDTTNSSMEGSPKYFKDGNMNAASIIVPTAPNPSLDINSFVKVRDIFKRPKKEVFELLKKDTYVRLKLTDDFQVFISSITKSGQGSARGSRNNTQTRR